MATQRTIFDQAEGERAKNRSIDLATSKAPGLFDLAKRLAVEIAMGRNDRTCSADDVVEALVAKGYSEHALGPAAGGLFRGKDWEFTGRHILSVRPSAHRTSLKVWRYVGKSIASRQDVRPRPSSSSPATSPKSAATAAGSASFCTRCRVETLDVDVRIHNGASVRRDCGRCGLTKCFPPELWNPPEDKFQPKVPR